MPFEFMKKMMMTGIGVALKTQSELEEMTKEFIEKTKMSEDEGKQFVDDMKKKYEEARNSMDEKIEKAVKEFMEKADLASSKELNALKEEIKELKKTLEK